MRALLCAATLLLLIAATASLASEPQQCGTWLKEPATPDFTVDRRLVEDLDNDAVVTATPCCRRGGASFSEPEAPLYVASKKRRRGSGLVALLALLFLAGFFKRPPLETPRAP